MFLGMGGGWDSLCNCLRLGDGWGVGGVFGFCSVWGYEILTGFMGMVVGS